MTKESIRVLVVEDHHVVRQGLVALLNVAEGLEVVGEAADGVEAIAQFRKHQPAITLIDLRLPRLSGVDVIERIRMETPQARFIVLTTYDGDEDIYQAMEAGATGYLVKGMPQEMLVNAVKRVHAGGRYLPPPVTQALTSRTRDSNLSNREREVLGLLANGKSNREIAGQLGIAEATVKCHVSVILMRLNAGDRTQAVVTALQRGLIHI